MSHVDYISKKCEHDAVLKVLGAWVVHSCWFWLSPEHWRARIHMAAGVPQVLYLLASLASMYCHDDVGALALPGPQKQAQPPWSNPAPSCPPILCQHINKHTTISLKEQLPITNGTSTVNQKTTNPY
ncbi:hypothetical protein CHARACLAT_026534 [Characodon lateralis]|uniref:Uncharacterized protein n=1 Tax=Characodon lateralis TaxID=208331 RepID=A0ABU7DA70_9TELE|nr:hypothetical protein [Characodon lateralis]